MLLERTVVAVNMVKLKTLACIVCTLACTITQSFSHYSHLFLTICLCQHNIWEWIYIDWTLSLSGESNSQIFFWFKTISHIAPFLPSGQENSFSRFSLNGTLLNVPRLSYLLPHLFVPELVQLHLLHLACDAVLLVLLLLLQCIVSLTLQSTKVSFI